MNEKRKFRQHLKAFLLSHQIGDDPQKYIARLSRIMISDPAAWDGKLPRIQFEPDRSFCKVVEASKKKPIVPWWWYAQENEPVPDVALAMYQTINFDFVLVFPRANTWVYILVEPSETVLQLLGEQDHMRAFILISLINKNFGEKQRDLQRLHLGRVMQSQDLRKIFTFVAVRNDNPVNARIPANVPRVVRDVDVNTKTTSWKIYLPGRRLPFESFKDTIELI